MGRMANGKWRIGMRVERKSDQLLPRPACLAGRHGVGRTLLPADKDISARRAVCDVFADQASGGVNTSQYRGRAWTGKHTVIHSVSSHRARFAQRIGNARTAGRTSWVAEQRASRVANGSLRDAGKKASSAHSITTTEGLNAVTRSSVSIRHSPFTIRRSS